MSSSNADPQAKEQARQAIADLVTRFKNDPKRQSYNESETRRVWLMPLFKALGWDTESPHDMTSEEQVSRGFADFGFYINGVPTFYLETKRVHEQLNKPENMRQSINYAYLKGVTWAVLSDFEQLMVFNADWETHDPSQARLLHLTYEQYSEPDAFEDLWLLSKPAMQARALDRRAERYGKKAIKQPVTDALFADLTDWRRRLFDDIRGMKQTLWASDPRMVDNAIQRLFDRLIFIRTMEDRAIESPLLLPILRQAKEKQWFEKFLQLFRDLDGTYNSNLFAPHALDEMRVADALLLKEIVEGLYEPRGRFTRYDFSVITADVLGAVYEQYLGFKANDPEAKKDTSKNKKRKTQGIYYTPQYVVRYIVQRTLGALLQEGRDPHSLRIVDPACGSGAFLIEAFDVLDRWLAETEKDVPASARRERILRENLFGVDLDEQAVEVTRLNLMLRAAFERRKIPTLTNIRHGNSLLPHATGGFAWDAFEPFDVVIGNPPYVRQETLGADFKAHAQTAYANVYAGTADLYVYFIEQGYRLLKEGGRMGYIVPNKWMRANYGAALRAYLQDKTAELVDFGDLPVFKDATTYPLIMTLDKREGARPPLRATVVTRLPEPNQPLESVLPRPYDVPRDKLARKGWSLAQGGAQAVLDKLNARGVPLGDLLSETSIKAGIKTGYNEAFVIDAYTRKRLIAQDPASEALIKPFLVGRDVKRYTPPKSDKYLIFPYRGMNIDDYPAIKAHLERYKNRLMPKPKGHVGAWGGRSSTGHEWYELQAPSAYWQEFEKPKIVFPDISTVGNFTIDNNGLYPDMTCFFIPTNSSYLLALLNSKVVRFYTKRISSEIRGGFLRWKKQYIVQLPIPRIDETKAEEVRLRDDIAAHAEALLAMHARLSALEAVQSDERAVLQADIARKDAQLDALVYALYGLSEADIAEMG
jgi:methylase of polypeptide subunit release factors